MSSHGDISLSGIFHKPFINSFTERRDQTVLNQFTDFEKPSIEMNVVVTLVICWGCIISETKGDWMESVKKTISEIINILYKGEVILTRGVTESVHKGLINQWVTPSNFSYDYVRSNVNFYVYTRQNWLYGQQIFPESPYSIKTSYYKPWKKTAVLVHGFGVDSSSDSVQLIKKRLLDFYDMNVIAVDYGTLMDHWWYGLCSPCGMAVVVLQAPKVGRCVAELIRYLVDYGQSPGNVHLIGHSLGAHVAGFTGKFLTLYENITVARITGLDPSSPGFTKVSDSHRLAKTDAEFTDCIYTTAESISVRKPLCQANFYPNGCGKSQPGCYAGDFQTYGGCSHSRAVYLLAESIEPRSLFLAKRCNGVPCIGSGTTCWSSKNDFVMGYKADKTIHGIFYTETNSKYPFSKEH